MQDLEWKRIKEVFNQVCDLPIGERESILKTCDDSIEKEVRILLDSDQLAYDFINVPVAVELGVANDLNIGQQIDDYEIVSLIGEGGMGNVYLAQRFGFEQTVAIKLVKRGMDTRQILNRFRLERQILSKLNHPNIAQLLDGGETPDGLPYFVMEYIEGLPITKFCNEHGFDARERLILFQQVCLAISYAHQSSVIHRDIKPSNIIVTADGTPKLLDFGIAKLLDSETETTATKARMFTPEYASPEQINGMQITSASDVYSLGVVLYELLSGVRPFNTKGKNYAEIANLVITSEPIRPSNARNERATIGGTDTESNHSITESAGGFVVASQLKGDLDNITLKALRKIPEARYQSAQELSEDISRHLNGFPITAAEDSKFYQFEKFIRRNKLGAGIASLILILSVFSTYQGFNAFQQSAKSNRSFTELRKTANELMKQTHLSLAQIEGSTQVQRDLVEKSIALLDAIAVENPNDIGIMSDLAQSYIELGNKLHQNFREPQNAYASYNKAIQLRQKILNAEPNNRQAKMELTAALSGLSEAYFFFGNQKMCVESQRKLERLFREIYNDDPNNLENKALYSGFLYGAAEKFKNYEMITETQVYLAQASKISDDAIRAYESRVLTAKETNDFAYVVSYKARYLEEIGMTDQALIEHERSSKIATKAFQMDNNLNLAINLTIRSQRFKADIYRKRKQFNKAKDMYKISIERLEQVASNPTLAKDPQLDRSLRIYKIRHALMLQKVGKTAAAKAQMETQYQEDLDSNQRRKDDSNYLIYSFEFLPDVAEYYVDSNQIEKAVGVWQKHLSDIEYFLGKYPDDVGFLGLKRDTYRRIGDTYAGYDEATKSYSPRNSQQKAKANEYYQASINDYESFGAKYSLGQAERKQLQEIRERNRTLRD